MDQLWKDYYALADEVLAERNKLHGKREAYLELLKHADLSPTDARTVIDALIKKEREEALEHAQHGLELLQGAGTMPESVAEATKELAEAAKRLREITGKETVKGFF
jgi:hypothetical protein